MGIQIWTQIIAGFAHIAGKNIEQERAVKHMKHFDMIEENCVIDAIILVLKERNVKQLFMIQKSYRFTKESIPGNCLLYAVTVVQGIFQKQH